MIVIMSSMRSVAKLRTIIIILNWLSFWIIASKRHVSNAKEDQKYEEVIADAVSMVVYKNIPDKSTATIKVPRFNENGKHVGYEVLGYDEWHERFNDLAMGLEKELNL